MAVDRDDEHEAATVVDAPRRKTPVPSMAPATVSMPTSPPQGTSGSATGASVAHSLSRSADAALFAQTLRDAELARTRRVLPFVIALALLAFFAVELVQGDPLATRVMQAAAVTAIVAITYLAWLARDAARFTEGRVALAYSGAVIAVCAGVFYWGIFSPAAALVGLAIFFVTLGRSVRVALMLYALSAGGHAALAFAILAGYLRDRGLIAANHGSLDDQIVQQLMLQAIYATTFLTGRATRAQLDKAVGDHDQAVRQVAQREALLAEARQDLDQALRVGAQGRYSDQTVGTYRLGAVLGRGAMGDVYEAVHVETGEAAAVKLLNAAALNQPGQLTRFHREAAAAAKLESPYIVRLLAVSGASDAVPFLAMERLHGRDLADVLRERRKLPLSEMVELVQHVAHGLEAARKAGIVHRDIKPQNIFHTELSGAHVWKLLDFGVSKQDDHGGTLTRGHVVGTPMYMAPEQARGEVVDHRADTLALATVAYRAVTGAPPYSGRDVPAILYHVVYRIPQRPGELVKLPKDVERVLAIGMAKRAGDRFATALELADAFTAAAAGKLSRELRERADALLAAHPWGSGG